MIGALEVSLAGGAKLVRAGRARAHVQQVALGLGIGAKGAHGTGALHSRPVAAHRR